jgi:hypothetical protein
LVVPPPPTDDRTVWRRLERRWQRRTDGWSPPVARTVRFHESVRLGHSADRVWELVGPAEHVPLLFPGFTSGCRVPGTPRGVGEQQCYTDVDGNSTVVEVVEHVEGRRRTTRRLHPREPVPFRSTWTTEPLHDGCVYSAVVEVDLPAGTVLAPGIEAGWRAWARAHFAQVRRLLDAEDPAPGPDWPR